METQLKNLNAASAVLEAKKDSFSESLKGLVERSQVLLRERTHYITQVISGNSGKVSLVEASTNYKRGTSTFQENRFKQNNALVVEAVEVKVGKGDPADMGAIAFDKAAPAALQNAHLVIEQDNRILLDKKVSDFIPKGTETSAQDLFMPLGIPMVMKDIEDFDIRLEYPQGSAGVGAAATTADTEIVKVAFRSYETSRKNS